MGIGTEDMILDTGANSSSISVSAAKRLVGSRFAKRGPMVMVRMADGAIVAQRSIIVDRMTLGVHVVRDVPMTIVPDGVDMLLGLPTLTAIGKFSIDVGKGVLRFD
jgi:predicted aspartyl protease